MTKIEFFESSDGLLGFHVHGHSGYAGSGEDIVCAAISSAVFMTMNTITDILNVDAKVSAENGDAVLKILSKDAEACKSILLGLKLHLLDLEEQYGEFMKVKFTEV